MSITNFKLKNFGPITELNIESAGNINIFIGENSAGKTFILKALYSAIKSIEEYKRGNDNRNMEQVVTDKLYWTFQVDKFSDLVQKGAEDRLSCQVSTTNNHIEYDFGVDTKSKITSVKHSEEKLDSNSVFLPPKEVLSISRLVFKAITDKTFGYDSTYMDLVIALQIPLQSGRNYGRNKSEFADARHKLEKMFDGRIQFDDKSKNWIYKKGNMKFPINTTAEGIKKIGILDVLLGNRYITPQSVIFIDEPESALHPMAISTLLEIIHSLAEIGIQFFISTHSYYVIKKMYLLAGDKKVKIKVFNAISEGWVEHDLAEEMPENAIINESIRLYKEEINQKLGEFTW